VGTVILLNTAIGVPPTRLAMRMDLGMGVDMESIAIPLIGVCGQRPKKLDIQPRGLRG